MRLARVKPAVSSQSRWFRSAVYPRSGVSHSDAHPDARLHFVGRLHQQSIDHGKLRLPEVRTIAPEVLKQRGSVLHERHEQPILNLVVLRRVHDTVAEVLVS